MTTVQMTKIAENGNFQVALNATRWLENVKLGDKVSQSDFESLKRGDRIFTHQSGGVTTIYSIVKYEDLPSSIQNLGLMEDIRHLH